MRYKLSISFFLILSILLTVQEVHAVGIGTYAKSLNPTIDFSPGLRKTFSYFMVSNAPQIKNYDVTAKGPLAEYFTLNPPLLENVWPGGSSAFSATLKLPREKLPPGVHSTQICVTEAQSGGGGIAVRTSACASVSVRSLFPGKYIRIEGFRAPTVDRGDILRLEIVIKSWSELKINSLKADIDLFGPSEAGFDKKIKTLSTEEKSLESNEQVTLHAALDTRNMEAGEYFAVATVDYDGETINDSTRFKIGVLAVKIIDYTKEFERGKVNRFEVEVESRWNRPITNIYGEIFVENENLSLKTSPVSLNPWERDRLLSYWEIPADKELGNYSSNIVVYFGENQTEEKAILSIVMGKEEIKRRRTTMMGIGAAIVLVLILAVSIYLTLRKRKNEGKKKRAKKEAKKVKSASRKRAAK